MLPVARGKAGFQAGLPLGGRTAVLAVFFAALVLATLFVTAFKHLKYGGGLGGWRCAPHAEGAGGTA